jgi:hypothetical protein
MLKNLDAPEPKRSPHRHSSGVPSLLSRRESSGSRRGLDSRFRGNDTQGQGMKFGGELNRLEHGPCWFPPIAENVLCNLPKLLFLRH